MIINHNMNAINAHRMMTGNTAASGKSMEKLSSGLRINKAGDDAAGLAISEKMRSQIRGLDQASRNSQDAISLIQTAEGALNETHSILQRMRELSVQASNDTNEGQDRNQIQKEINQLTSEINRIGNTTEFNKKTLLKGDFDFAAATSGVTKASVALDNTVNITNTATNGSAKAGAFGGAGFKAQEAVAAGVKGNIDVSAVAIAAGTNNELTLKVDGAEKHYTFADAAAGDDALTEINAKIGGDNLSARFDSNKNLVIESKTAGAGHSVEVLGGGFATSFMHATDVSAITKIQGTNAGDVWVHGDTAGKTTGSVAINDTPNIDITAANNELTLSVNGGADFTVALTAKNYNAAGDRADLITDLNTALAGKGVKASLNAENKVVLTSDTNGVNSKVEIKGAGLADSVFGLAATRTSVAGQAANNKLSFTLDGGATKTDVAIADKIYRNTDDFVNTNKAAFDAKGVTLTNEGGNLKLTSKSTGVNSGVTGFEDNDLTKQLGLVKAGGTSLDAGNFVKGANGNTTLKLTVDGEAVTATIQEGSYTDKKVLAAAVESAINSASTNAADVKVTVGDDGKLSITSGKTGSTSDVTIVNDVANNKDAAGILGLTTNTKVVGEEQKNAELKFQIGANENQSMGLKISDMRSKSLGLAGTGDGFTSGAGVTNGTDSNAVENGLDVSSFTNAAKAITTINKAIEKVSDERSKLGAYQNRLEHTINNLSTSSENLTAAESRIRDVDMAKEMMTFSKNNILSQAAQAMLGQANQQPQGVLQLLR